MPTALPPDALARLDALVADATVVVASWAGPEATVITLHDFVQGGETFVPVFSSADEARRELRGSGFEDRIVGIDARMLAAMLDPAQVVRLDAAGPSPLALTGADVQAAVARSGRPPLDGIAPQRVS